MDGSLFLIAPVETFTTLPLPVSLGEIPTSPLLGISKIPQWNSDDRVLSLAFWSLVEKPATDERDLMLDEYFLTV